ncbi:hypothetical protein KVR01_007954 [Diaporthe batatas]|uniref:uncharacterized protein n=1 Tax=Diaporthe batatas TaxID=748121 RepID=UPI001D03F551|nr:uncharacterized protein KVR01_007954 [Diaporthe batatas]KAG8162189.1 hypothetical protein KVR01_007954 [Diaporthe batatas]
MHFKIGLLVAAHIFLTAMAESMYCYQSGEKFSDLGDNMDISNAFNRICDRIGGKDYKLGQKVSDCENVGDHSLDVSIKIKEDSYAENGVVQLYKTDCSSYFYILTDCSHGGSMDVSIDGSHEAKAAVKVDPQRAQC